MAQGVGDPAPTDLAGPADTGEGKETQPMSEINEPEELDLGPVKPGLIAVSAPNEEGDGE